MLGLLLSATAAIPSTAAVDTALPEHFQESTLPWPLLERPVAVRFAPAPDTRVFVAEQDGVVEQFDGITDMTPTVAADLRDEVSSFYQRGLLGLAVDPGFPTSPYLYLLYTYGVPLEPSLPSWGDDCPDPPHPDVDGCVVSARLSRIQIDPQTNTMVPGSEAVLVNDWCGQFLSHSIADLGFGADGALYASAGDGAFNVPDYGQFGGSLPGTPTPKNPCGDPPTGVGGAQAPPTAEGGMLRAQDVRTPSDPVGLDGSLIRVDPATGAGLPDNPLHGSSDANARRIVAYGMRNPYRFTFRPGTDEVWIGDVGRDTFEEVDRVPEPSDSAADNLGWPCYEGPNRQPLIEGLDLDLCEDLYDEEGEEDDGDAVTPPYFTYRHDQQVVPGEPCPADTPESDAPTAISGMTFYKGGSYPAAYQNALFFADYARRCIWVMERGANGLPDPAKIRTFASGAAYPLDLQTGAGGDLFYVDRYGAVRRIHYASPASGPGGGTPPPVAPATVDRSAPLLSRLTVTNRVFAARRGRGTAFRFRLSERAVVSYRIERMRGGRRAAGVCRKPSRALRERPLCTRHHLEGTFSGPGSAGRNRRRFSGFIGASALSAGRYLATLRARDGAGNRSHRRRVGFTVVARSAAR